MGPTNVALVKYFQADQLVRQARERLDAATKDVRVQERRVNDLLEKQKLASATLKTNQAKSAELELEVKSRDAHIEKLRTQQQNSNTDKEYRTFLVEINTFKADKSKIEEETLKLMALVEKDQQELAALGTHIDQERAKLDSMKQQITEKTATLQAEINELLPAREQAAAALPKQARDYYDRLADRFDGEAMASISKPDKRREEYMCGGCNMDLVVDVYNKLHSRDEMVFCPSCRRILYIPEDLTPDVAVKAKTTGTQTTRKASTPKSDKPRSAYDPRTAEMVRVLTKAAGESAKNAIVAGNKPGEFEILVENKLIGVFKGQNVENLKRTARFCLHESGITGEVEVREKQATPAPAVTVETTAAPPENAPMIPSTADATETVPSQS